MSCSSDWTTPVDEEEPKRVSLLLRVSTRRMPKEDKSKLVRTALDQFCGDMGHGLPKKQALLKEEEREE
jgi:hypothetical protein